MARMSRWFELTAMTILLAGMTSASFAEESSYSGMESRAIKALSEKNIAAYEGGEGMGLAMAAELNRYPGPKHVLELGGELELTETQLMSTQEQFEQMKSSAVELGRQIVELERQLDQEFNSRAITSDGMTELVGKIGQLQGQLRAVHLQAHLQMVEILTPDQVARYDSLRGYGARDEHQQDHHGDHEGHSAHKAEGAHASHGAQHAESGHGSAGSHSSDHGQCTHGSAGSDGEKCAHGGQCDHGGECPHSTGGHQAEH